MAKRRGRGEGSIYKRTDGAWAASVQLGYHGATRKRKTFYGKTRREVQEKLAAAQRDVQRGLPLPPERQTVGAFLQDWLENSARATRPY